MLNRGSFGRRRGVRERQAFTLVELLAVIGIIAVLIGLLVPRVGAARKQARMTKCLSDMRQMTTGYTQYHINNGGRLMLGYPPAALAGGPGIFDSRTGVTYGGASAGIILIRYPWRLLPYVGSLWEILHSHEDLPPLPAPGEPESDSLNKAYELSVFPTYGINATYLGGDLGFNGFIEGPPGVYRCNYGKHVAFKANEVKRPSEQIVFADAQYIPPGNEGHGSFRLTPPRAVAQMWKVESEKFVRVDGFSVMAVPKGWHTKRAVVGFFDGHAQAMLPSELEDMRLWAKDATKADYVYPP